MLVQRIYLRNYRVFEQELELAMPPGLVGVYGPNGAGKSTLLESVLWALWGRSRTPKEQVPSAGARGECVSEVTFEHEGHLYLVRRTISGANATVRAQAHCDGLAMAEGVRDTARYVHSVLGMDDAAFRASVFAEQKQLAAFSDQGPADRRKLVLALLGVTPLDTARDRARADARETAERHRQLRALLPDLAEARTAADDAAARAAADEVRSADEHGAAQAARERAAAAQEHFQALDLLRQQHELLVAQGRAARAELSTADQEIASVTEELAGLERAEAALAEAEQRAAHLGPSQTVAALLTDAHRAATELAALPEPAEPEPVDEAGLEGSERAALAARSALGAAEGMSEAAARELDRAQQALARSAQLSEGADCPLCGQALGDAFAQVQRHRRQELAEAEQHQRDAAEAVRVAAAAAAEALSDLERANRRAAQARQERSAWEQATRTRAAALGQWRTALDALSSGATALARSLGPALSPQDLTQALSRAKAELDEAQAARQEASRLRGRLERRPQAEQALRAAQVRSAAASSLVEQLRAEVRAVGFDPAALAGASQAAQEQRQLAEAADLRARQAALQAAAAGAEAASQARRANEAVAQHAQLAELESTSTHLSRTAELLNGFRNSVVASVGPRLAVQAADLFGELTDNEYDRLEVDPDTYGLQISDGGTAYALERFSGSEVDLANLALRVAISEHVRFQSGGSVGLLVLDEVFGPLDDERRARMLMALERLRGRFRQVLVVTHSTEIKEQLPSAIEVVKKPGRRASARVVDQYA